MKKTALQETAPESIVVCRDFCTFCNYIIEHSAKLTSRTRQLCKKDCFALNSLFYLKETYDEPTKRQVDYPLINYFYYVALTNGILQMNPAETKLLPGPNYSSFMELSEQEQYILFLVAFLYDGSFAVTSSSWYAYANVENWPFYICLFMGWVAKKHPVPGKKYKLTRNNPRLALSDLEALIPGLLELGLARVWKFPDSENLDSPQFWEIEVTPLLRAVSTVYEQELEDCDEAVAEECTSDTHYYCMQYGKCLLPNGVDALSQLFELPEEPEIRQTIDLEVHVVDTDCIRVIRMNTTDTLYDLHRMIQVAVDFDDDHLFQFIIGTGMMRRTYTLSEVIESSREFPVEDTLLMELDLKKGKTFKYLFDFGDMWWFDIKVLGIADGTVDHPQLIRSVNESPSQYPDYEDAW